METFESTDSPRVDGKRIPDPNKTSLKKYRNVVMQIQNNQDFIFSKDYLLNNDYLQGEDDGAILTKNLREYQEHVIFAKNHHNKPAPNKEKATKARKFVEKFFEITKPF